MEKQRYWFLAPGDEEMPGVVALSPPWWPEAVKWEHREGNEYVAAPVIYTTKERAEGDLRAHREAEPDAYLNLVGHYGERITNEALKNTLPLRVFDIDGDLLLSKLEDSDFLCIMVDDWLKLRRDFIEELKGG
jgi:hypothetical protein